MLWSNIIHCVNHVKANIEEGIEMTLILIAGVLIVLAGVITLRYPELGWKYSLKRMLYLKGGEPTDFYKDMVKTSGVMSIVIGGVIILGVGIFYWTNYGPGGKADLDGIVVEINDKEMVLPCTYDDIKELGFLAVNESDLTEISADREKSVKVKNSKNEYLTVVFINTDVDTKDATECKIYEIKAEYPVTVFDYSSIPDYTIDEITSGSYSYSSYINETQTDANRGPKISLYNGFSTNNSMESNQKAVGDSSFGMRGHTDISIKQGVNRGLLHASYGGNSGKELAYVSIKVYP